MYKEKKETLHKEERYANQFKDKYSSETTLTN